MFYRIIYNILSGRCPIHKLWAMYVALYKSEPTYASTVLIPSPCINMSRRFISTVIFNNRTYASKLAVKAYVEQALKDYCATSGLDAQGAEKAVVK